ncbi:hypothetical protein BC940DRAFT_287245 [Gongronella butleri]|nr:hypothetical protein BC940DRAFT_287245 [Gongronella butleri]
MLLAACVSGVLIFYRLVHLGHSVFDRDEQGNVFPRLTESVMFTVFFFCIAKSIHCIVLHVDAYPNAAFRVCLFNIVVDIGGTGIAVAVFAALFIFKPDQYHLVIPWISPRALRRFAFLSIFLPATVIPVWVPQAVLAQLGDSRTAYTLETVRLTFFILYSTHISLVMTVFNSRAVRVVKRHRSGLNAYSIQAHRATSLIRRMYLLVIGVTPVFIVFALVDVINLVVENTTYHQPTASSARLDVVLMALYQFAPSYTAAVAVFFVATQRISILSPTRLSSGENSSQSKNRSDAPNLTKPDDGTRHWGPAHTFSMSDSVNEGFYEELIQSSPPANITSQTYLTE